MKKVILILLCGINMGFASCYSEEQEYTNAIYRISGQGGGYAFTNPEDENTFHRVMQSGSEAAKQAFLEKFRSKLEACLMKEAIKENKR
ncbi:hypothetical protein [Helicobacter pullorum]|uniref:Lipoprotein n=1 Tax=Helicobacter pullorum TaxID=35818 RepID=A0A377PZU1_9HELI|nr:hypothetical protein [Helicobacter pullorum]STQ88000.1 Uncharacterised protein [Helicobacter pullorum]